MLFRGLSSLAFVALASVAAGCQPETDASTTDQEPTLIAQEAESLHGFSIPSDTGALIPQGSPLVNELYAFEAKSWLRWAMALPFSTGPITDPTGAACGQGQSGPVFYLAGTSGGAATRSCTIPAHRFLYLPLINFWVLPHAEDVAAPADMASYLDFLSSYIPYQRAHTCNLSLKVDGAPVLATQAQMDSKLWTQALDPFSVEVNDDNFASQWGVTGYTSPVGVTAGDYALLRPLSPGDHLLEYGGALCDDDGAVEFETSVVYHLTVGQ